MKIAVSSWALHRTLGATYPDSPETGPTPKQVHCAETLDIVGLPAALQKHGFATAEICHFHLRREAGFLRDFRSASEDAGVEIQSLLIDNGDLSDQHNAQRDADWMASWVVTAGEIGAKRARIIAGKAPFSRAAFEAVLPRVIVLAALAEQVGVRLTVENWFPLMSSPSAVLELLERTEGKVGLCADMGNWDAPQKYEDLPQIFPQAETCHAKCEFIDADTIEMDDYGRCLKIARDAGFSGPMVLVNGGPADEWHALALTRLAIESAS